METDSYPMQGLHCGAKTRAGKACRNPPTKNGRCRMHGGASKAGREHGRYTHGQFTKEAVAIWRELRELCQLTKEPIGMF